MSQFVKRTLAVSLVLMMLLGDTALAATTYNTAIKLRASNTSIQRGQRVIFSGELKSTFRKCFRDRKVTLYRNGVAVESQRTDRQGDFRFVRHPNRTRTWRVKFAGKTGGTHPNQWICEASASNKIRVQVTG